MYIILGSELLLLSHVIDAGLAGTVYAHPKRRSCAIKIYNDAKYCEPERIDWLCHHPPPVVWQGKTPLFAWPEMPAHDASTGMVVGYSMPRVLHALPLQRVVDPRGRSPGIRRPFLWKVACSMLTRVHTTHLMNFIVGDANTKNFLVNRRGVVTLLDVDSMHFTIPGGRTFTTEMNRPEYQPPDLLGIDYAPLDRRQDQDAWTLASLVWKLLHEGEHPFDCHFIGQGDCLPLEECIRNGLWPHTLRHKDYRPKPGPIRFSNMPKTYQELMRRMFDEGHADFNARPSVTELLTCLEQFAPWGTRRASAARWAWRRELQRGARPKRRIPRAISWAGRHKLVAGSAGIAIVGALALPSAFEPVKPTLPGPATVKVPTDLQDRDTARQSSRPQVKTRSGNEQPLPAPVLWKQALLLPQR